MDPVKVTLTNGAASLSIEGSQEFVKDRLLEHESLTQLFRSISAHESSSSADQSSLDHTWQWFALHAEQRMQGVNFFLVATTIIGAGFVAAVQSHDKLLAIGVGVFGMFITFYFSRLELRVRELIHAGEAAMKPLQARLAIAAGIEQLRLLDSVELPKFTMTKYSHVIRFLHWTIGVGFGLAAIYAYFAVS